MALCKALHLVPAAVSTCFSALASEKHIAVDTSGHDECRERCGRGPCSVGKDADSQSDGEFKRASWLPKQSENHQK